jgi:transcription initiation factor TFIIB
MTETASDSYPNGFDEDVLQNEHNTCPECRGRVTTNVRETVCDDCGLVLEDAPIDPGPEWRSFEEEEDNPERTGAPLTPIMHDRGLSTEIGWGVDGTGARLSRERRCHASKLRREQGRTARKTKREQNRMHAIFEIRRLCAGLELSDSIRDQACQLFRSAQSADLLPGRSLEAITGACVYAVCRCNRLPVTKGDIRRFSHGSGTSLESAYKTLNTELGLPTPPREPGEFLPRFVSELDLPRQGAIERRARELVDLVDESELSVGQNPRGVAAACIYQATKERERGRTVTQAELAGIAEVTPMTLRKQWRAIPGLVKKRER